MRKETVALVAVVAVLVVSAVAGPTLASMTSPGDDVNKTTSEARYALDDLQDAGTRVPEIHDGWRPISGASRRVSRERASPRLGGRRARSELRSSSC